jgi:periplasmic protein TonB
MKPAWLYPVSQFAVFGLLASLAGCASVPTRHATTEEFSAPTVVESHDPSFTLPVPLDTTPPVYPVALRRAGITGTVRVDAILDANGRLRNLKATEASDSRFITASMNALKKWTFNPAKRDGVAVSTRINIPIEYSLLPE